MTLGIVFLVGLLIYLLLISKAGKTFPILYLFLFIYYVQYLLSTYLIYNNFPSLNEWMPIKQEQYFYFTVPAFLSLFAGVFLFNKDADLKPLLAKADPKQAANLGYLLLVISYSIDIFPLLGFSALNSIVSFTTYLKYIGAFSLLLVGSRRNYVLIGIVYFQLLLGNLAEGIFIDFFVWSTYLFFFFSLKVKMPFWLRVSSILIAVPLLILVQGTKDSYRNETWKGRRDVGINTFSDLAISNSRIDQSTPYLQSEGVVKTVGRLTQGWHLALTLKWVPRREPLSNGDEMLSDLASSILPRVMFVGKKLAATQDKFKKYTGYQLRSNTSMTIGLLGDFYVNFGKPLSFLMLFVYGMVVSRFLQYFISRFVLHNPVNIIWIPFMLNYLVRANNDFYTGLNCIVKGFLIFLVVDFIKNQIWPRTTLLHSH